MCFLYFGFAEIIYSSMGQFDPKPMLFPIRKPFIFRNNISSNILNLSNEIKIVVSGPAGIDANHITY